jgi:GTP 3',8-cyclase
MREFSEFKVLNHFDRIRAVLAGELPPPVTLELDPTNVCNHRCVWCIDCFHRAEHAGLSLAPETALRVVREAKAMGVRSLVVKGGGEPLVWPHIDALLQQADELDLEVGVITNGERLLDHAATLTKHCRWLRISLDAGTAETHRAVHRPARRDAFERVWRGIRRLSREVCCGIVYVVHPDNCHEMVVAARKAKRAGCRYIAYKRVIGHAMQPFDRDQQAIVDANFVSARKELQNGTFSVTGDKTYSFLAGIKIKPYSMCLGHHLVGVLCANGGLYACCSTRGISDYCYGNVNETPLAEIWQSARRRQVLKKIAAHDCGGICAGKTSYMRYDHYNDLFEYLAAPDNPHKNFL